MLTGVRLKKVSRETNPFKRKTTVIKQKSVVLYPCEVESLKAGYDGKSSNKLILAV